MSLFSRIKIFCFFGVLIFLSNCGDNNFTGVGGVDKKRGKSADSNNEGMQLTWQWPCKDQKENEEPASNSNFVIEGPGPHELSRSKFNGTKVQMNGAACIEASVPRAMVFIVDASWSMGGNLAGIDRLINGSCERFKALKTVIRRAGLKSGSQFGIVTYSNEVRASSTDLFDNETDLFEDLVTNSSASSIAEVICDSDGGTNYEDGLTAGYNLFGGVDQSVQKEIYFISDGEPFPAKKHGSDIAARIRTEITIATIMMGDANDDVLKNKIASKDEKGYPLHARANSSKDLAGALAKLSENNLTEATLKYGNSGSLDSSVDFSENVSGMNFSFDAFELNTEAQPDGVDISLVFSDRFGNTETKDGRIKWIE